MIEKTIFFFFFFFFNIVLHSTGRVLRMTSDPFTAYVILKLMFSILGPVVQS